jgi:hypothetical protein
MFEIIAYIGIGIIIGMILCAMLVNRVVDEDKEASYHQGYSAGRAAGKREIVEAMEKKYCVGSTDVDSEEKSDA